jgi:hypothetical protein
MQNWSWAGVPSSLRRPEEPTSTSRIVDDASDTADEP